MIDGMNREFRLRDDGYLTKLSLVQETNIFSENGFHPFCSDESMYDYEFSKTPDLINLKDLYFIRF
jgi:hypothetical protein